MMTSAAHVVHRRTSCTGAPRVARTITDGSSRYWISKPASTSPACSHDLRTAQESPSGWEVTRELSVSCRWLAAFIHEMLARRIPAPLRERLRSAAYAIRVLAVGRPVATMRSRGPRLNASAASKDSALPCDNSDPATDTVGDHIVQSRASPLAHTHAQAKISRRAATWQECRPDVH